MIPKEEFASRINKVRTRMSELGLGALISLDTGAAQGYCCGDVRYLTNYVANSTPSLMGLVVTPKTVALCVDPGLVESAVRLAQRTPLVTDAYSTGDVYAAGVRRGLGGALKEALSEANVARGKIGIDGLNRVVEPTAKGIRDALSNFEIVERTNILVEARKVKSPAEWKEIREAVRLADIGSKTFINSVKAGGSVPVSISEAEHAAKMNGAEQSFMIMSPSGKPFVWGNSPVHGSQALTYAKNDMVTFEMNATYQGYYGQVARAFIVGKASDAQKRYWETGMETINKMVSMLKPGAIALDIFLAGNKIVEKAGYKPVAHRNGHGMGLTMGETLNIIEDDHSVIKPDYYLELHMNSPHLEEAMILFGGGFRVTETGHEDLHNLEYKMEI